MQINNRPQVSFQGAVKYKEVTEGARALTDSIITKVRTSFDRSTQQRSVLFKDAETEASTIARLNKLDMGYFYQAKRNMTALEFDQFVKPTPKG